MAETDILQQAVHWAASNGLTMLVKQNEDVFIQHCPMSLEPFVVPKDTYGKAQSYALPFNLMTDRVARNTEFLYDVLKGVESSDPFTGNLLKISKTVHAREGGIRQKVMLGLNRSDYMINEGDGRLLQVELNTISASFGVLSTQISRMHRFLQGRFQQSKGHILPENNVTAGLAEGIAAAHNLYVSRYKPDRSAVVFVVQGAETNIADQRPIEYRLFEEHGVAVFRLTLAEVNDRLVS